MRMNLRILIMGIVLSAFIIVYANHVVNIDSDIKVEISNVKTACEQGVVYEQVGILQKRSCEINFRGSFPVLDADERDVSSRMGLQSARFAVPILLLAMVIAHVSHSEKKSGYRRYRRRIWTRRTVY